MSFVFPLSPFAFPLLPWLALIFALSASGAQEASAPGTHPAETYRLRVENIQYGRVEASADGGAHYILVGRVLRPATTATLDQTAMTPGVVIRSGGEGIAFAVAPGLILKLRPGQAALKIEKPKAKSQKPEMSALLTDLERKQGFLGDLLPPVETTVHLQIGSRRPGAFPEGYTPDQEDVFHFLVSLPLPAQKAGAEAPSEEQRRKERQEEIGRRLEAMGQAYREGTLARARAEKRRIVSGILTLRAKLPVGEPEPITAAMYVVDGDVVAAQNVMPFTYGWDTRRVPNGEHVVEIRALSQYATLISRVRALVVVQNGADPKLDNGERSR